MFRVLQSFLLLSVLSACAVTPSLVLLDAQGFGDAYMARFQQRTDAFAVEQRSALELALTSPDGDEFSVSLGDAYAEYQRDPTRLIDLLDENINATAEVIMSEIDTQVDIEQVLAVIKNISYVSDDSTARPSSGEPEEGNALYYEQLNAELVVIYVQDNESSARILNRETIASFGLSPAKLRELANANLARRLSGVQTQENAGVYLFELDGFYESSLILLDEIWQSPALKTDGEIVVALPARDVLMVTGSNNKSIGFMRKTAGEMAKQSAHAISPELFLRRNGGWQVFAKERE